MYVIIKVKEKTVQFLNVSVSLHFIFMDFQWFLDFIRAA